MEILTFFIAIPFLMLLFFLLPIIAIVDIIRSKFEGNDNILMLLLVVFVPFGAIIYFIVGNSRKLHTR